MEEGSEVREIKSIRSGSPSKLAEINHKLNLIKERQQRLKSPSAILRPISPTAIKYDCREVVASRPKRNLNKTKDAVMYSLANSPYLTKPCRTSKYPKKTVLLPQQIYNLKYPTKQEETKSSEVENARMKVMVEVLTFKEEFTGADLRKGSPPRSKSPSTSIYQEQSTFIPQESVVGSTSPNRYNGSQQPATNHPFSPSSQSSYSAHIIPAVTVEKMAVGEGGMHEDEFGDSHIASKDILDPQQPAVDLHSGRADYNEDELEVNVTYPQTSRTTDKIIRKMKNSQKEEGDSSKRPKSDPTAGLVLIKNRNNSDGHGTRVSKSLEEAKVRGGLGKYVKEVKAVSAARSRESKRGAVLTSVEGSNRPVRHNNELKGVSVASSAASIVPPGKGKGKGSIVRKEKSSSRSTTPIDPASRQPSRESDSGSKVAVAAKHEAVPAKSKPHTVHGTKKNAKGADKKAKAVASNLEQTATSDQEEVQPEELAAILSSDHIQPSTSSEYIIVDDKTEDAAASMKLAVEELVTEAPQVLAEHVNDVAADQRGDNDSFIYEDNDFCSDSASLTYGAKESPFASGGTESENKEPVQSTISAVTTTTVSAAGDQERDEEDEDSEYKDEYGEEEWNEESIEASARLQSELSHRSLMKEILGDGDGDDEGGGNGDDDVEGADAIGKTPVIASSDEAEVAAPHLAASEEEEDNFADDFENEESSDAVGGSVSLQKNLSLHIKSLLSEAYVEASVSSPTPNKEKAITESNADDSFIYDDNEFESESTSLKSGLKDSLADATLDVTVDRSVAQSNVVLVKDPIPILPVVSDDDYENDQYEFDDGN